MLRIVQYFATVLFIFIMGCNPDLTRPLYLLDGEMDASKFGHSEKGMKVGPGDVIYVDLFEAYKHNKGKTGQVVSRMRIPLRKLGESGYLKEYEKAFLMQVLATGAKKEMQIIAQELENRNELIGVWNFMVDHLQARQKEFNHIDLMVNWHDLPGEYKIKEYLQTDDWQELIMRPRDHTSIYRYSSGIWTGDSGAGGYYQRDPFGHATPFLFINYTVQFNGLLYCNKDHFPEESSWSLYDWLYCGVSIVDGMDEEKLKTGLYKIALNGQKGRFRIVRSSNIDFTHTIRYDENNPGIILWPITDPKYKGRWLQEEELRYVHPAIVRKLKFK